MQVRSIDTCADDRKVCLGLGPLTGTFISEEGLELVLKHAHASRLHDKSMGIRGDASCLSRQRNLDGRLVDAGQDQCLKEGRLLGLASILVMSVLLVVMVVVVVMVMVVVVMVMVMVVVVVMVMVVAATMVGMTAAVSVVIAVGTMVVLRSMPGTPAAIPGMLLDRRCEGKGGWCNKVFGRMWAYKSMSNIVLKLVFLGLVLERVTLLGLIQSMDLLGLQLLQEVQEARVPDNIVDIKALQEILVRGIRTLPYGLDGVLVGCNEIGLVGLEVKDKEKVGVLNTCEVEKVALLTKLEFGVSVVPVLDSGALGEDDGIVARALREKGGDLFAVELGGELETGSGKHVGGNGMGWNGMKWGRRCQEKEKRREWTEE